MVVNGDDDGVPSDDIEDTMDCIVDVMALKLIMDRSVWMGAYCHHTAYVPDVLIMSGILLAPCIYGGILSMSRSGIGVR